MKLELDILTMLYFLSIGNFVWFLLYLFYFRVSNKNVSADILWLSGKALQGTALLLLALRGNISLFLSIILGNAFLYAGAATECLAVLMVAGKLTPKIKAFYVAAASLPISIFFLSYGNIQSFRVTIFSFFIFLMLIMLGGRLLFAGKTGTRLQRLFGLLFFLASFVFLARTIIFSQSPYTYNLFTPLLIQTITHLTLYLLMLVGGIGFLLIIREKVDAQLLRESRIDYLTELPNRRSFFEEAAKSIAYCSRAELPAAIIIIDIDHFKQVNDKFGHETGDEVLKYFGKFLAGNIRQYDVIGRTGGEEFAIFLPNTQESEAMTIAQRIKQDMHSILINTQKITFTISIGLCVTDFSKTPKATLAELLVCADRGLYEAKTAGRNRISIGFN